MDLVLGLEMWTLGVLLHIIEYSALAYVCAKMARKGWEAGK